MDKRYKVVFKGQLLTGFSLDEVCSNLAVQFKADAKIILQRLSQPPVILKSGLDVNMANHYLEALANDGLMAHLEVIQPDWRNNERRLRQRRGTRLDRRLETRNSSLDFDRRRNDRRKPR
jgi:2,4-dienoyl-CoA reductase-like NADH-dependent reductase (Old Yellow Enzyme family)